MSLARRGSPDPAETADRRSPPSDLEECRLIHAHQARRASEGPRERGAATLEHVRHSLTYLPGPWTLPDVRERSFVQAGRGCLWQMHDNSWQLPRYRRRLTISTAEAPTIAKSVKAAVARNVCMGKPEGISLD